jgi:hypothetical protein
MSDRRDRGTHCRVADVWGELVVEPLVDFFEQVGNGQIDRWISQACAVVWSAPSDHLYYPPVSDLVHPVPLVHVRLPPPSAGSVAARLTSGAAPAGVRSRRIARDDADGRSMPPTRLG